MFSIWTILLPIAGVVVGLVMARILWKPSTAFDDRPINQRLADSEKRIKDELERVRETFNNALRDMSNKSNTAQQDQTTRLTKSVEDYRTSVLKAHSELKTDVLKQLGKAAEHSAKDTAALREDLTKAFTEFREQVVKEEKDTSGEISQSLKTMSSEQHDHSEKQIKSLNDFQIGFKEAVSKQLKDSREEQTRQFEDLTKAVRAELDAMRKDNESKLETIRATVDEKLQQTLEKRLGASFSLVSDRLEQVHKGLGEMQALATGVGDLKRVLTNVRSRGTFGETQLEALLEQILAPSQYEKNCATKPGSNERVEFAIRFPGKDDVEGDTFLPIDAKFPREDYERIMTAQDSGDSVGLESARRSLRQRLIGEAATIREKYIAPPYTLDIGFMFLPVEGLYLEALRLDGLVEEMQTQHRVILVGPTTLYAVLNSLRMGFQTLAIQKRSSEVWRILGAVKTEFGKFGDSLNAVGKRLEQAHNTIDDTLKRSRAVERKLRDVESLPASDAVLLLPDVAVSSEEVDENE